MQLGVDFLGVTHICQQHKFELGCRAACAIHSKSAHTYPVTLVGLRPIASVQAEKSNMSSGAKAEAIMIMPTR